MVRQPIFARQDLDRVEGTLGGNVQGKEERFQWTQEQKMDLIISSPPMTERIAARAKGVESASKLANFL